MKLFYIVDRETATQLDVGWRSLELGNGKLLVCINWKNEAHEFAWSSRPDVISLPHPIFESSQALSPEHVQHLAAKFHVTTSHNVHDVIKQAAREDLWMRCYVL